MNNSTCQVENKPLDKGKALNSSELMISQYFENGRRGDFVEIKNLSNRTISDNEYYLALYKKKKKTNRKPSDAIKIKALAPGEVRLYNKFQLKGDEIVIISISNSSNCFRDRVDIIGNNKKNGVK